MRYEEARQAILASIHFASGALNDPLLAGFETNSEDVAFSAFEFDSLSTMEFCLDLEERTGVEIDLGDLASHPSINNLAEFISAGSSSE